MAMKILGRLLTGGLVGFAVALFLISNPAWQVHAVAAVVSVIAVVIDLAARREGRGSWVWNVVPLVAFGVVYWLVWL